MNLLALNFMKFTNWCTLLARRPGSRGAVHASFILSAVYNCCVSSSERVSIATTQDKTCWDKSRKCLFFCCHPGRNWNLRQMNARFPHSSYPKLFRIAWQLYTLVFRPRQLWIGRGEGVYFLCLGETGVGPKVRKYLELSQQFCPGL